MANALDEHRSPVTSWRDTASTQAQEDFDGLLPPALGFAQQQLTDRGEFYPYAVAVNTSGEREMIAARLRANRPKSADIMTALIETLTSQRDRLRAVAIVANTRVSGLDTDAVRVILEHREGPTLGVVLPYNRRRSGGGHQYGQLQATTARPCIW